MEAWVANSLTRFYPASQPQNPQHLTVHAARGEKVSFQAVLKVPVSEHETKVKAQCEASQNISVQIRRVGYVPMPHFNTWTPHDELDGVGFVPGYVPDPLFPEDTVVTGSGETHAFWVTVRIPKNISPGEYPVKVVLSIEDKESKAVEATIVVHPAVLQPRQNFPVTHWFYADCLLAWYKLQPWEPNFWSILDPYIANVVEHGQDTLYVPVFTPPLDGIRRPAQLLGIERRNRKLIFSWDMVRQWVTAAKKAGISRFEWVHLFTQWGVKNGLHIYKGHGEKGELLFDPSWAATSKEYRKFLQQYLSELEQFLHQERLTECSFFHVSDEPHGSQIQDYRAAREMLRELAPWMKIMDALSDLKFASEGLTDIPVPSIETAPEFAKAGHPAWAYFCCGPRGRYLNRLLDTPLPKIKMTGWLLYKLRAQGFLHWGYNSWFKSQTQHLIDPFTVTDGLAWPGWAYGDTFMVYPGESGPIDTLRWEIFAESLQDLALLQDSGIEPGNPLLSEIHDYADFPKKEDWVTGRKKAVLEYLDKKYS